MGRPRKVLEIKADILTCFLPFEESMRLLVERNCRKKIPDNKIRNSLSTTLGRIPKEQRSVFLRDVEGSLNLIDIGNYKTLRRKEDKGDPIYEVTTDAVTGEHSLSTGKYCGVLHLSDGLKLVIGTGYSSSFFRRILAFCCGLYLDDQDQDPYSVNYDNFYSLLVHYLFLISLRKVANAGFPRKYQVRKGRGYAIQGNIDVNQYINYDICACDKKVSYIVAEQVETQCIVDTLYYALSKCSFSIDQGFLPNLKKYKSKLKNLYSGTRPSSKTINEALTNKILNNSLYAIYKTPLRYAKILIDSADVSHGERGRRGATGFLVDTTMLWEMYLATLLSMHFPDWTVESQAEIHFYQDRFFRKNNYADIVMTNQKNGEVFVLDAKFKKMTFRSVDVDNSDIQQIHSYAYYYHLKYGDSFLGAALVYPTKANANGLADTAYFDNILGLRGAKPRFGILTILDPGEGKAMKEGEALFIHGLRRLLSRDQ